MHSDALPAAYAVLRTADVGTAEVLALLSDEWEADRLAAALNAADGDSYFSEVSYEPIWETAEEVVEDLALDIHLPENKS